MLFFGNISVDGNTLNIGLFLNHVILLEKTPTRKVGNSTRRGSAAGHISLKKIERRNMGLKHWILSNNDFKKYPIGSQRNIT